MTSPIRIVIADDHPTLSLGLRGLLEVEPDLNVIGEAGNVSDVVDRVLGLKPDILLLDLKMPSQPKAKISARGGLDVLRALSGSACITRTILFAADMDTQEIVEAIELGVRGVLLKSAATQLLVASIRAVMSGACWEGTRSVPSLNVVLTEMRKELDQRKFGLTPKELDVASAVVTHSMANNDIAHFFKIAENTVKKHITSIYNKVGVSNRLELDHFAREHKLPLRDLF